MRSPRFALVCALTTLTACGDSTTTDEGGAAHIGVVSEIEGMPQITIDDEVGTDVRVFMHMDHMGGPDAQTFEVVSASLQLDLEHYADIELAIPADHTQFTELLDGDEFDFELRGHIADNGDDWGLCASGGVEDTDGLRVTLSVLMRVTPGANDGEDEFEFESLAVELNCSFTG
ncbi:hypothetical protein [Enhygromyxa salina]|nr:hypothetical protein [Enhygromyxa salina]